MSTTPRPVHRRQPPWLLILLLLFFATTWARSCFYVDEACMPLLLFENRFGQFQLTLNPGFGFATYVGSSAIHPPRFWLPFPVTLATSTGGTLTSTVTTYGIYIAHWFLILLTLIAGFILHTRKRKQLRLLTELQDQAATHHHQ